MAINTGNTKLQRNPPPPCGNDYGIGDYEMGKSPSTRGAPGWERGNAMADGSSSGLKMRKDGADDRMERTAGMTASKPK